MKFAAALAVGDNKINNVQRCRVSTGEHKEDGVVGKVTKSLISVTLNQFGIHSRWEHGHSLGKGQQVMTGVTIQVNFKFLK